MVKTHPASRLSLLAFTLLAIPGPAWGQDRPVVAIFQMEDRGSGLDSTVIGKLTTYLSAKMAEGGYQVIPQGQIRERLKEQVMKSYKECFDANCQIELGRELAAQKTISSQILKIGGECKVTATIYDLRKKAAEKAATVGGACTEEALLPVLDQIALDLCRGLGLTNLKTGYLLVKTQPSGAVVDVQGVTKGTSPLTLELDSGNYPLRAHTEGYEDKQDSAVVSPGRTAGITLVLRRIVPMDPMEKWGHAAFWAGVGVTAFGGVSTFLFKSAQDDYRDGKWDVEGDIEQWHTLMWTGFSVGGALMVTGALLWILSPSEQEWRQEWIEKHPTVGVSSDGDDFFVTVGGEW